MIKRTLLIHIFLSLAICSNLFSQNIDEIVPTTESPDSLKPEISKLTPLLLKNQFEIESNEHFYYFTEDFNFLRQKVAILGFELGKSLLENNYSNPFGADFRPKTVSEYNYAVERYRIEGDIPIRRTGWLNFRSLFD